MWYLCRHQYLIPCIAYVCVVPTDVDKFVVTTHEKIVINGVEVQTDQLSDELDPDVRIE